VVEGDGVILNLAGFALRGKPIGGIDDPDFLSDGVGVRVRNSTGVTVKNGSITNFKVGVVLEGGSANVVKNLLIQDNQGRSPDGNFGGGINISSSNGNTIRNNNLIHNGPNEGIGLFGSSSDNLIVNNVVRDSDSAPTNEVGIRIEGPGATNNTVRGNTVTGSAYHGIYIDFGDPGNTGNKIVDNLVEDNGFGLGGIGNQPGDGIRVGFGVDNVIRGNRVQGNAANGILIGAGSKGNRIISNVATDNNRVPQPGRSRFDLQDLSQQQGCGTNVYRGNTFGTAFPDCTKG